MAIESVGCIICSSIYGLAWKPIICSSRFVVLGLSTVVDGVVVLAAFSTYLLGVSLGNGSLDSLLSIFKFLLVLEMVHFVTVVAPPVFRVGVTSSIS